MIFQGTLKSGSWDATPKPGYGSFFFAEDIWAIQWKDIVAVRNQWQPISNVIPPSVFSLMFICFFLLLEVLMFFLGKHGRTEK